MCYIAEREGGVKMEYIYDGDGGELYHFGVKGMKWGVRRAAKRRSKYLNKTETMANIHKQNAGIYSKNAKKLKSMSDSDYEKQFDDLEYLKAQGGSKKAKDAEIKYYETKVSNSIQYAKSWINAHDAIMNTPIGNLKSNKDYEILINSYLNQ